MNYGEITLRALLLGLKTSVLKLKHMRASYGQERKQVKYIRTMLMFKKRRV